MDFHIRRSLTQQLLLDLDQLDSDAKIDETLHAHLANVPPRVGDQIKKMEEFERSGSTIELVDQARVVWKDLNEHLRQQQLIYDQTIIDILKEVKNLKTVVRKKDEEIHDLNVRLHEYSRKISDYEAQIRHYEDQVRYYKEQIRHLEDQIRQLHSDLDQKNSIIISLEVEIKSLQSFKLLISPVDVEKNTFDIIRKTLLAENLSLRKWKVDLDAKVLTLEQLKFQLSADFIKLTETILINAKHQDSEELTLTKGRLAAEKENVALLQQQLEKLLLHTKNLEAQIFDLRKRNQKILEELSVSNQQHDESTKTISELNQKILQQSNAISLLSVVPDIKTPKADPSDKLALKVLTEKFQILSVNHESTLKTVEDLQRELELVRTERDSVIGAVDRYHSSLVEIRKVVLERVNVSLSVVPPITPSPPKPNPPSPRTPKIADQAQRYSDLLQYSPPPKRAKN